MKTIIPAPLIKCVPSTINYSFSDFEKLYDKYAGAFYNIILIKINNEEAANKILENTFCFAFKNMNDFDSSRCLLFTWIKNILQSQIDGYINKSDNIL